MFETLSVSLFLTVVCGAYAQNLLLTIAYSPNTFGNAGAVVSVDTTSGDWSIVGKFTWPHAIWGNPYEYDPIYFCDANNNLYLDINEDFGYMIVLNVPQAKVTDSFQHSDPFFVGFENMYLQGSTMYGVSGVGNDDGIYSFGKLDMSSHKYTNMSLIKFKAMMDDTAFIDTATSTYYTQVSELDRGLYTGDLTGLDRELNTATLSSFQSFSPSLLSQGDYDQRPDPICPGGKELCIIAIDLASGDITSVVKTPYTIYKYAPGSDPTQLLAWIEGGVVGTTCQDDEGFQFATVNLVTGAVTPGQCASHNLVIQEQPWISEFSQDSQYFATGSRWSDETQLLVFEVSSGDVTLNTTLAGLDKALGASQGLYYIWDITWA